MSGVSDSKTEVKVVPWDWLVIFLKLLVVGLGEVFQQIPLSDIAVLVLRFVTTTLVSATVTYILRLLIATETELILNTFCLIHPPLFDCTFNVKVDWPWVIAVARTVYVVPFCSILSM